jgi:hypothetical protein
MEQITNVNVTDIEDNQVLAWDVATSKWVNITIGGLSTPTLLEVTNAGNEIETDINVKSIFFKIGDLDEDNSGTGIAINNDESSISFFRNLENFMDFTRGGIGGTNSLGAVWGFDFAELEGAVSLRFPNKTPGNYAIATIDDVISSNTTATNGTKYLAVANLTMSDITPPSEGAFYEVTVINGTATIGGVGYTVGQKIFRHYHSGSWRSFIYGGSGTASTLQEVTEAGNETTVKTIFKTSETEWIEIGGDSGGISVFNDLFGSLPTPKRIIDIAYNGIGINTYDVDTGEPTGFAGIGDKTLVAAEVVGGVLGKYTTIYPDRIVKGINGTTSFDSFLPSENNDLNGSKVISTNTTAKNAINYLAVANLTMSDITPPSEGAFYEVTVINGTSTIGGVGYTVGQKVFRHYHSGSWRTFVTQNANSLSKIVIKDTASSAPVTGSTLNTLAKTYEIQGGVFDENDAFNLEVNAEKTGVNGTSTIRVYVNTTNNFATATLYSTTASASASIRDIPVSRLRSNFKGTNLIVVAPGSGLLSDLNQGFNAPRTALSLNPANTFFIFVAIQNANAGDSTTIESVHLTT